MNSESFYLKNFIEQGVCMLGECCPFDHGSDPVILNDGRNSETSPTGPCYQKSTGRHSTS